MSYSFSRQASSKSAVIQHVAAEFDDIVSRQPLHKLEKAAVLAGLAGFVGALADDPDKDIVVSVVGSITAGRDNEDAPLAVSQVSFSISATLVTRNVSQDA